MKNVLVFGASGRTGQYIVKALLTLPNCRIFAFVRDPGKMAAFDPDRLTLIKGDALNAEDVSRAVKGQEILLCSLEGDVLTMAENIAAALPGSAVRRIVWITGMGIHHEITGPRGRMLARYAAANPEYIEAADRIAACPVVTTLLRCPQITDGNDASYELTAEGEQPRADTVERAAIARFMANVVKDETVGAGESLAITAERRKNHEHHTERKRLP